VREALGRHPEAAASRINGGARLLQARRPVVDRSQIATRSRKQNQFLFQVT